MRRGVTVDIDGVLHMAWAGVRGVGVWYTVTYCDLETRNRSEAQTLPLTCVACIALRARVCNGTPNAQQMKFT